MKKLAVLVCAASLCGCIDGLECEDGLVEVGGICRIPDSAVGGPGCGPGTHLEDLMCVPDLPPTECDPETTEAVVDENGVTVCRGSVPPGCTGPIACPSPDGGDVSICGFLVDLETRQRIWVDGQSSARCDLDNPSADGPCSLRINFYDALAFVSNPNGPTLDVEEVVIDECGRFRAKNVTLPFNKTIGVSVDDAAGVDDVHATTGVALILDPGERHTGLNAYAAAHSTDQMWTDTGNPDFAPETFAEHGVYVPLFVAPNGDPVAGVQVTASGTTRPNDTYYFSDPDNQLTTVDASLTSTGPNGAALLVGSSLGQHSGSGGETGGCSWESALATSQIGGVVFVQEKHLVDATGEPCPE